MFDPLPQLFLLRFRLHDFLARVVDVFLVVFPQVGNCKPITPGGREGPLFDELRPSRTKTSDYVGNFQLDDLVFLNPELKHRGKCT